MLGWAAQRGGGVLMAGGVQEACGHGSEARGLVVGLDAVR